MTKYTKANEWHVVSAETFAKQAVDVLGQKSICCGSIAHDVQVRTISILWASFSKQWITSTLGQNSICRERSGRVLIHFYRTRIIGSFYCINRGLGLKLRAASFIEMD